VVEFIVQVVLLAIATLGKKIGWRGVALPGFLKTRSSLKASLILGLVWSVWHLPFWLLRDSFDQ
jgi:membrane protease YdiL (CAAX protease family)